MYEAVKAIHKAVKVIYKAVKAMYKEVNVIHKAVKAMYKEVKVINKAVKAIYKAVKAIYKAVTASTLFRARRAFPTHPAASCEHTRQSRPDKAVTATCEAVNAT